MKSMLFVLTIKFVTMYMIRSSPSYDALTPAIYKNLFSWEFVRSFFFRSYRSKKWVSIFSTMETTFFQQLLAHRSLIYTQFCRLCYSFITLLWPSRKEPSISTVYVADSRRSSLFLVHTHTHWEPPQSCRLRRVEAKGEVEGEKNKKFERKEEAIIDIVCR